MKTNHGWLDVGPVSLAGLNVEVRLLMVELVF